MFLLRNNVHTRSCAFGQVFFDSGVLPTTISRRPLGAELFWCWTVWRWVVLAPVRRRTSVPLNHSLNLSLHLLQCDNFLENNLCLPNAHENHQALLHISQSICQLRDFWVVHLDFRLYPSVAYLDVIVCCIHVLNNPIIKFPVWLTDTTIL